VKKKRLINPYSADLLQKTANWRSNPCLSKKHSQSLLFVKITNAKYFNTVSQTIKLISRRGIPKRSC